MNNKNIENNLLAHSVNVTKMFDDIAPNYDKLNDLFSLGNNNKWKRKMLAGAGSLKNMQALDIATGTGDVAFELIKRDIEHVTAVDPSSAMLEICEAKIKEKSLDEKITCIEASAELLPLNSNKFDIATISFGLRNFDNIDKSLEEINRILKPDGQIVIMEFFNSSIISCKLSPYRFYMKNIVPFVGKKVSKHHNAYKYLFSSINEFYSIKQFAYLLQEKGFFIVKVKRIMFGIAHIVYAKKMDM